jgi:cytoskeleton protein RodZ
MSMTVGEQLQQARLALQRSVKEMSQATKIQPWIIESLEANRLDTSMSPVYARNFLITYAKFLKMDYKPLVAQVFPPADAVPSMTAAVARPAPAVPRPVPAVVPAMAAVTIPKPQVVTAPPVATPVIAVAMPVMAPVPVLAPVMAATAAPALEAAPPVVARAASVAAAPVAPARPAQKKAAVAPVVSRPAVSRPAPTPKRAASRPVFGRPLAMPALPRIALPKIVLPKFQMPKLHIPKIALPKVELPRIHVPTLRMPRISMPQVSLPSLPPLPTFTPPRISWSAIRRPAAIALGICWVVVLVKANPMRWLSAKTPHQEATIAVAPAMPTIETPKTAPAKAAKAQAAVKAPVADPLEVTISARRTMWISVKVDGRLMAQHQLAVGNQESWKANKFLEVVIARPSQADVTLNGKLINPMVIQNRGRLLITHKRVEALPQP